MSDTVTQALKRISANQGTVVSPTATKTEAAKGIYNALTGSTSTRRTLTEVSKQIAAEVGASLLGTETVQQIWKKIWLEIGGDLSKRTLLETLLKVEGVGLNVAPGEDDETILPIIIGDLATKFGMTTPAGSGRHVQSTTLKRAVRSAIVAHWDFAGASIEDATYSGVTGVLNGDAAIVANGSGYALQVSGAGYLNLAKAGGYMDAASDFTASCWCKITTLGTAWFDVLSHVDGSGKWEIFYNNTIDAFINSARNTSSEETYGAWYPYAAIAENTWRHLAITYRAATKTSYLYLNGTLVATAYSAITGDMDVADSANLRAGEDMTGLIGDIMLFNRALTEDEITNVYANQYGPYHTTPAEIYTVTTTAASGAGSLAEGILTQERARTIIFETSGTIAPTQRIQTASHNRWLTIAGETAPSPGITLKDYSIRIGSRDCFIRHIRGRIGTASMISELTGWSLESGSVYSSALAADCGQVRYNGTLLTENPGATTSVGSDEWDWDTDTLYVNVGEDPDLGTLEYSTNDKSAINDPFGLSINAQKIVIDHCSLSWGADMNLQSEANDFTIQYCFVTEALDNEMHLEGPHSMGMYFKGHYDGSGSIAETGRRCLVYKNLVAFNEDRNPSVYEGSEVAILNNLMAEVQGFGQYFDLGWLPGKMSFDGNVGLRNGGKPGAYIDLAGSRVYIGTNNSYDGTVYATHAEVWAWANLDLGPGIVQSEVIVETPPIEVEGLGVADCATITTPILQYSGARPADRDAVDLRVVQQVLDETGGTIEDPSDVGGWPTLAENTVSHSVPASPWANSGNGYTNLEVWLHSFAFLLENVPMLLSAPETSAVSPTQVDVSWDAVADADTYSIFRSTDGETWGSALATGLTGTSYSDETCEEDTGYYYAVACTNTNGTSGLNVSVLTTTPTASGYDASTQDFINRFEGLGGSFDQSGSGYSETTIKDALDVWIAGLKTDAVWDDLIEVYLWAGGTFGGLMAKVKYLNDAALTNNGFVSGDYLAVGSGAGLKGDVSSGLDSDLVNADVDVYDLSFGGYITERATSGHRLMGFDRVTNGQYYNLYDNAGASLTFELGQFAYRVTSAETGACFVVGTQRAINDREMYRDGGSVHTQTSNNTSGAAEGSFQLFRSSIQPCDARMTMAFIGRGLSDAQAAALSSRTNTLMTALGCNVY